MTVLRREFEHAARGLGVPFGTVAAQQNLARHQRCLSVFALEQRLQYGQRGFALVGFGRFQRVEDFSAVRKLKKAQAMTGSGYDFILV